MIHAESLGLGAGMARPLSSLLYNLHIIVWRCYYTNEVIWGRLFPCYSEPTIQIFGTLLCVFMYPIGTMSHIDTWIRLSDKQSSGMKLRLAHINGTYVYFFLVPKNVYC
jgi:hypothetical protein